MSWLSVSLLGKHFVEIRNLTKMCRSSLSSNSEGDDDMGRYSRSKFDPILSQTQTNNSNMTTTPYMLSRDTGQPLGENGGRKDDKYWERRRLVTQTV